MGVFKLFIKNTVTLDGSRYAFQGLLRSYFQLINRNSKWTKTYQSDNKNIPTFNPLIDDTHFLPFSIIPVCLQKDAPDKNSLREMEIELKSDHPGRPLKESNQIVYFRLMKPESVN